MLINGDTGALGRMRAPAKRFGSGDIAEACTRGEAGRSMAMENIWRRKHWHQNSASGNAVPASLAGRT